MRNIARNRLPAESAEDEGKGNSLFLVPYCKKVVTKNVSSLRGLKADPDRSAAFVCSAGEEFEIWISSICDDL